MQKRGDKRGIAKIIVTIILVAVVLIAVGVIWAVISNIISKGSEDISLERLTIDAEIKGIGMNETTNNSISILVRRKPGQGNLAGFKFVFKNETDAELKTVTITLLELEEKRITFNLLMNVSEVITISLIPLIKSGDRELLGAIVTVYNVKTGRSITPGPGAVCGNNITEVTEVCDGTDLNGETCITQGFAGGSLACLGDCSGYDTNGCNMTELGLVAYYPFNGDATDASGYGNDGTIFGADCTSTGKLGQACSFDGIDDYIDTTDMTIIEGSSKITISSWVYLDDSVTDNAILSKGDTNSEMILLWFDDSDTCSGNTDGFSFIVDVAGGCNNRINSGTNTATTGQWYHVAAVMDGGNRSIYIDGVLKNSRSDSPTTNVPASNNNLIIGNSELTATTFLFNGSIDEVRIYNRTLDASEIANLANVPSTECNDGIDNDGNGCSDYPIDSGCTSSSDNDESGGSCPFCGNNIAEIGEICDGSDLNGENCTSQGFIGGSLVCLGDCSGFDTSSCTLAQCQDTIDNDADGSIDYPNDFGCSSLTDNDEINNGATECSDGIDNDADTFIDQDDPDCISRTHDNETTFVGAAYYVDINNLGGPCDDTRTKAENSITTPWCSIQRAADLMTAGDTVIVREGTYNERVDTIVSGSAGNYITYLADGNVIMKGFIVNHNYIQIDGFDITGSIGAYQKYIDVASGDYIYITNNKIHDGSADVAGIKLSTTSSYCTVNGNTLDGIQFIVMAINGDHHLIENNSYYNTEWDTIRIQGNDHIVRGNYFNKIDYQGGTHTDIIQAFGDNGEESYNIIFEQNFIEDCYGKVAQLTQDGIVNIRNWTFRNNLYVNVAFQAAIYIPECKFYNNTFYRTNYQGGSHVLQYASGPGIASNATTKNNFFIDCGESSNGWYMGSSLPGFEADYNYVTDSAPGYNAKSGFNEPNGINGGDPLFVNISDPWGPDGVMWTDDDGFRLQSGSPACGAGEGGSDIGAYSC